MPRASLALDQASWPIWGPVAGELPPGPLPDSLSTWTLLLGPSPQPFLDTHPMPLPCFKWTTQLPSPICLPGHVPSSLPADSQLQPHDLWPASSSPGPGPPPFPRIHTACALSPAYPGFASHLLPRAGGQLCPPSQLLCSPSVLCGALNHSPHSLEVSSLHFASSGPLPHPTSMPL